MAGQVRDPESSVKTQESRSGSVRYSTASLPAEAAWGIGADHSVRGSWSMSELNVGEYPHA